MAATLVVAWNALGPTVAVSASVASLLIGMLDRRQSPPARFRTMLSGTVLLAVATLVTHRLSPWPLAIVGLLVVVAFAEGSGIAVHPDVPLVMQLTGIVVATALLEPQAPGAAGTATLAVLAAGTAQTVVSTLAAASDRSVVEVEATVAAIDSIASATRRVAELAAAAPVGSPALAAVEHAARAVSAAQRRLRDSDLDPNEQALLDGALFAADRMRIDAMAVLLQLTDAEPGQRDPTGAASARLSGLSDLLDAGGRALRDRRPLAGGDPRALEPDRATPTAVDPAAGFISAVNAVAAVEGWQRVSARQRGVLRQRIRFGPVPLRFGARLSLAALVSAIVGATAGLVHGSWTINAGLSVLRPDGGARCPG